MSSEKKRDANRNNSRKSTGPKSARGKAKASLNAVRHGIFATQRILPGEDSLAYRKLSNALRAELRPEGPVEEIIFDQIVGEVWRLRRLEEAEKVHFEHVRESQNVRVVRALREPELAYVTKTAGEGVTDYSLRVQLGSIGIRPRDDDSNAGSSTSADFADFTPEEQAFLARVLDILNDWGPTLLEGIVTPKTEGANVHLEQRRRTMVRALLRYIEDLKAYQAERQILVLDPKKGST